MYYVYMIRCQDNSIYTGITTDLVKRMREHFFRKAECARYTRSHPAADLEAVWSCKTRSEAAKLEYAIKRLSKADKEQIIADQNYLKTFEIGSERNYEALSKEEIFNCKREIKK